MAKTMLVISNESGRVIGTCVENLNSGGATPLIAPACADHKMYRVTDVPEHITAEADARTLHEMMTNHLQSDAAKARPITAAEYSIFVRSSLA